MTRKLRIFQVGLVANAALVIIALILLQRALNNAESTSAAVDRAVSVSNLYAELDASVARAVAAHRAFLMFAEPKFVADRKREMEDARRRAGEIAAVSEGEFRQASQAELEVRLDALDSGFVASELLRRGGAWSSPELQRLTDENQVRAAAVQRVIADLGRGELRTLEHRRFDQAEMFAASRTALLGTLAALALVVATTSALFMREARGRQRAEATALDLAESLPGAVFRYRSKADGSSRYEMLSSATESLRGVDRAAALRDPGVLLDTIVEGDRRALLGALAESARTMTPLQFEFRARVRDEIRWFRVLSAPKRDHDGSIVWSGHWDDVTVRRSLEEELLRSKDLADAANRAKSVFLATMSHEIRTPMNGVLGMLELLDLSDLDAEQRATLAVIRESGRSLLRIIDDILDFSKIEAGKLDLVTETVSPREVVERVWAMFSGTASSKGLLLTRFFDSRISPAVTADPVRLQQILANFVSNALKFTASGGASIAATLVERREGRDVIQFIVADTGVGLSQEQQALLFQPFSQVREGGPRGGTGLGLSIARRLASLMDGSVEMESAPGQGTRMTFTVSLAIADPATLPQAAAHELSAVADFVAPASVVPQGRVLVVDDHPINRLVLMRQVQALGYEVETAEDGRVAFQRWSEGGIHTVVTDCNMPGMNGYDLTSAIREAERGGDQRRTVIVACTANVLGGEAEKCLAAGMDDYLAKPVSLKGLSDCLSRYSANPARSDAIDRSVLAEVAQGDDDFARELLSRFADATAGDCQDIRIAAMHADYPEVASLTHRLKGACAAIGALTAAAACGQLEAIAHAADASRLTVALEHVESAMRALRRQILVQQKSAA